MKIKGRAAVMSTLANKGRWLKHFYMKNLIQKGLQCLVRHTYNILLYIPVQRAEPSTCGCLALKTRTGRFKSSFVPWEQMNAGVETVGLRLLITLQPSGWVWTLVLPRVARDCQIPTMHKSSLIHTAFSPTPSQQKMKTMVHL